MLLCLPSDSSDPLRSSFLLMKQNTTEGVLLFFFYLKPSRFISHPDLRSLLARNVLTLLSLHHVLQPVASCQHRQPITFLFSCISDNQTSLVLYFLKHYTSHHYTVHKETSMYFNASLFHPLTCLGPFHIFLQQLCY